MWGLNVPALGKGVCDEFCSVLSAAVIGLRVEFIHVEADVSNGLPVFHMVGYLLLK